MSRGTWTARGFEVLDMGGPDELTPKVVRALLPLVFRAVLAKSTSRGWGWALVVAHVEMRLLAKDERGLTLSVCACAG